VFLQYTPGLFGAAAGLLPALCQAQRRGPALGRVSTQMRGRGIGFIPFQVAQDQRGETPEALTMAIPHPTGDQGLKPGRWTVPTAGRYGRYAVAPDRGGVHGQGPREP